VRPPAHGKRKPLKLTPKKGSQASAAKKATPKPRTPPAHSGDWMPAFLTTLRDTANVRLACSQAGITRQAAYQRKQDDADFAAAWEEAHEESIDTLEAVARSRAIASSDLLVIFLLKSHRREVYGDKVEVTNQPNRLVIDEETVPCADDPKAHPTVPKAN